MNFESFMPHRMCFAVEPALLWLFAGAGLVIGFSYLIIAEITARNGTIASYAFAAFVLACGIGHFFSVVTLWIPIYWESAAWLVLTAVISAVTAWMLASGRIHLVNAHDLEEKLKRMVDE